MKKNLLLSLLLLSTIMANAQIKFISNDLEDARQLADSIALNAKFPFKFVEEGIRKANNNHYFKYQNTENESESMTVYFIVKMEGENKDLEIKGKPKYIFNTVYGRFLNLFPFWKQFINPESDPVEITEGKMRDRKEIDGRALHLRKEADTWCIVMI